MSLKYTTVTMLLFCTIVMGCGKDSAPISSQATNYEVGDDSTGATAGQTSTPQAADFQAASPVERNAADPATSAEVPPRRPVPMNETPAADPNSPDFVQPTPEQLLTVIRRLREQEPAGSSKDEVIADFMNLQTQLIQAVDMLLGLKPADAAVTEAAAAKIAALTAVAQL
ncbi:MAG: hypothetical protein ABI614_18195, partial [Planctomycetota bacterium]